MPIFVPGQIVATKEALHALDGCDVHPTTLLDRHCSGDWGEVGQEDCEANERAVREGGQRVLSKYVVQGRSFYVITEHDRSYTTLMLTSDY